MEKLLFVSIFLSGSEVILNPEVDSIVQEGLEYAYQENYETAEYIFDKLIEDYPEEPIGYLLKAGLLDLYMLDFSTYEREKEFYSLIDKAIKRADRKIRIDRGKRRELAWDYFYKGSALAYRALMKGRKREYLSAVRDGLSAVKELRKALEIDSSIYDAYLPLGTYDYAISVLPGFVKGIISSGDTKEKGLREIEMASEKGLLTKVLAQDALAWTLAYNGDTKKALKIVHSLTEKYPTSRGFKWTEAYVYRRMGDWVSAERTYEEILSSVLETQRDFPYAVSTAMYWVAVSKMYRRKWKEAYKYADTADSILKNTGDRRRTQELQERINKLKEKISKKIAEIEGVDTPG